MQQIDKIANLLRADYKEKSFKDSNTQTNEINFKAEKQATAIINILEGYFGINSVKKVVNGISPAVSQVSVAAKLEQVEGSLCQSVCNLSGLHFV